MQTDAIVALILLISAFALFIPPKIPYNKYGRTGIAVVFGIAMVLFGLLSIENIPKFLNIRLLLLLAGMMMMVAGLETAGFFDAVTEIMTRSEKTKGRFLAEMMVICAFLSAIMLNDTVVLLMTPIAIKCCSRMKANPIPYLIGVFIASNIGGVATVIGNPQNAYIATKAGIGFIEFTAAATPVALMSLAVAIVFIYAICRKELRESCILETADTVQVPTDRRMLKPMLAILVCTVVMFALSDRIGLELYQIAIVSGAVSLVAVSIRDMKGMVIVVKRVNWSILVFFIGMFLIMGGVVESGLLVEMSSFFGFGAGSDPTVWNVALFSAVLSNLVSNVPSVMLIGEMLPPDTALWMALAMTSTLAGNATLIGAAANILVAEEAAKYGVSLEFRKTLKVGIPVAAVTVLIAATYVIYFL